MSCLKTPKVLREEIAALSDRVQAIVDLAKEENRELSADEVAEVDAIQGVGESGGKLAALQADLLRAEKIEARALANRKQREANPATPLQQASQADGQERPRAAGITIPHNSHFRYGSLKAFKGEHAEQSAYLSGMFLLATLGKSERAAQWCKDRGIDTTFRGALREGSNDYGGYLVPIEMEQSIIDLRETYGVFARFARLQPMQADTYQQPKRSGGVTAYFVGEGSEITASDPTWTAVALVAKKLGALTRISSELSEDAVISVADAVAQEIAYAFAVKEDQCGFNGDATSTYGGITGLKNALAAGSIVTAASGNTSFETLDLADFESCIGKLPEYAEAMDGPAWFISKAGWAASMMRLLDAAGGNTTSQLQAGAQKQFLGYPVVISQVLNSTLGADTSAIKCYFGNLSMAATLGRRRGVSIQLSDDRYFEYDQIGIKGTQRFDINVHEKGTASAAGAMIALKTAAS